MSHLIFDPSTDALMRRRVRRRADEISAEINASILADDPNWPGTSNALTAAELQEHHLACVDLAEMEFRMDARWAACEQHLTVPCASCGRPAGERCRTADGRIVRAGAEHAPRHRAVCDA